MKKKILIVLILALTLTACDKDKPQSTVGLVKPTEETTASSTEPPTELDINNSSDSIIAPQQIVIGENGEMLSEQEIKKQESQQQELIENQDTIANETEPETISTETISYEVMQEISEGVDTYAQEQTTATMRQTAKTEVARLKAEGIIPFQNITDEMIDSYSKEELDNLMIEIYKNIKY